MKHSAERLLRGVVPRKIVSAIRLLQVFQGRFGHCRTDSNDLIVDGSGESVPWLTYPATEFLCGLTFSEKRVFEFGAGASTLFWARRSREVVSVAFDAPWYARLTPLVPANALIIHESDGGRYADAILKEVGAFDMIVVDGVQRHRAAASALKKLVPGGMIILDNSQWYPRTANLLAARGLMEVRFSGFSPLNAITRTTTIFFSRDFAFPVNDVARLPPVGGKALEVLAPDDGR